MTGNGHRTFEDKPATREQVPIMVGLFGPSGGGKTYSALRLATGIQRVSKGEIFVIDTEARRALHYAEKFKFRHLEFGAPFGPLDYLAAIEHCVDAGAGVVIVDSMSHEHEGPGGVLEMHDAEVQRMGGEKHNFRAWSKPKAERRRLINRLLQLRVNAIFCFRAKEKARPDKGARDSLKDLGWMPIAGEEFVYELTTSMLLPPASNGVPDYNPEREGERAMVKLPVQFREMLASGKALSEDAGEALARWAAGGEPAKSATKPAAPVAVEHVWLFPSGKHAGKTVQEVGADYLQSLIDSGTGSPQTRAMFQEEIERRVRTSEGTA